VPDHYPYRGDGAYPTAGLTALNGQFYGTTYECGEIGCVYGIDSCGTVFTVSTTGKERILYRFKGENDGGNPVAGLTLLNGTLYGTASLGGSCVGIYCKCQNGCGTIFSISGAGKEHLAYSFLGGKNGASPQASLTVLNRTLYGTTFQGGGSPRCEYGCGTIFAFTP
jgi:uncharacterized repeat protein (TIGR03803 family)